MNIVLVTPLYPPDIAEQARYIKETAARLAKKGHGITIVAYAHIPEKIPGVRIIAVSKRTLLPIRLIAYTKALTSAAHTADIIYAENGPSVELPVTFVSLLMRLPFVMHIGDKAAHERSAKNVFLRYIKHLAHARARAVIADMPATRPEILPFQPVSLAEHAAYDTSWETHINSLTEIFTHV
mgnify:FL=1